MDDKNRTEKEHLSSAAYFYIFSFPRSGNTWLVNSLSDYLGARRAEILPSRYGGRLISLTQNVQIILADKPNGKGPIGVKSHMPREQFAKQRIPKNRMLYVYRDPRDVMISYYFYRNTFLAKGTQDEKGFDVSLFLENLKFFLPKWLQHINGWLEQDDEHLLPIRYEQMQDDYIGTLKKIKIFLGYDNIVSEEEVKEHYRDNFKGVGSHKNNILVGDNSAFYRKGIVGDWKNYFNDEHIALTKRLIGDALVKYGYEEDRNW